MRTALFIVALMALAACETVSTDGSADTAKTKADFITSINKTNKGVDSLGAAMSYYSGYTRNTYSPWHGTQVEYNAPDGGSYLWYPGNRAIVKGRWKVKKSSATAPVPVVVANELVTSTAPKPFQICYQYGLNTYNPVTKQRGGDWQCSGLPDDQYLGTERQKGDPFGLSRRTKVPFTLSKKKTSIDALLSKCRDCAAE